MNFQKNSSHIVIKFHEKTKHGKESIDVIPISWTFQKKGKLYCKYPSKKEYDKLDKMSKESAVPEDCWKMFEITKVKEARSYDQGLRRMIRACSDTVIHSSNVEERNSSEEEIGPLQLSGSTLKKSLDTICELNENSIFHMNTVDQKNDGHIQNNNTDVVNISSSIVLASSSSSSSCLLRKQSSDKIEKQIVDSSEDTDSSTKSFMPRKRKRKILLSRVKNDKQIVDSSEDTDSSTKSFMSRKRKKKILTKLQSSKYSVIEDEANLNNIDLTVVNNKEKLIPEKINKIER
ncbi:uncharacterized protein LOC111035728 [Myzus persicae]|uniref:uncharacterized protein LOC111035728 n=1 Tax=Myzus persicae TaxID=13164 RepID=UPI000B937BBD|nr:uncharacterized protein LOC111035728 [Myzus persicae]